MKSKVLTNNPIFRLVYDLRNTFLIGIGFGSNYTHIITALGFTLFTKPRLKQAKRGRR